MNFKFSILFIACLALPSLLYSEQFVLFDTVCTWPSKTHPGGTGTFFKWIPEPDAPRNWLEPVNYKDGTMYMRYEVLKMEEEGRWAVGMNWFSPKHGQKHKVSVRHVIKKGEVLMTPESINKNIHDNLKGPWDWSAAVKDGIVVVLEWQKPTKYRYWKEKNSKPKYGKMKPIVIHAQCIVVSKGGTYQPVKSWKPLPWRIVELTDLATLIKTNQLGKAYSAAQRVLKNSGSSSQQQIEAKMVSDFYTETLTAAHEKAFALKSKNPAFAIESMTVLIEKFGPSDKTKMLEKELSEWKKDPKIKKELQAQKAFEKVKASALKLREKLGAQSLDDPGVAQKFKSQSWKLKAKLNVFYKKFPESIYTEKAKKLADEFRITINN